MSADIRFVPHAAEADADIFPAKRLGNARADAGLAGTGRADKEQDRAGLLVVQAHHGELLDDAPFNLFQAEMVFVQNLLRFGQRREAHIFLFPGKRGQKVQVIVKHPVFVGVGAFLLETV